MTPRIQKAIDIFLDALNEGTLTNRDCTKCAVGNLVRKGCGYSLEEYNEANLGRTDNGSWINWSMIFVTDSGKQKFKKNYQKILKRYPEIKKQIDSTDFTIKELAAIEKTFETSMEPYNYYKSPEAIRENQLQGLAAVIEVMLKFDEQKDSVQEVFTSKAELIPV